jgi:hypothetical protein
MAGIMDLVILLKRQAILQPVIRGKRGWVGSHSQNSDQ